MSIQYIRYTEALSKLQAIQQVVGHSPHLAYNIALCHYKLKVIIRIAQIS